MELGNVFIDPLPEEGRKKIPGILLNTLPKSASVYLWNALSTGLDIPKMRVSGGWWPVDLAVPELLKSLARGGAITQEHLDPSWQNKVALSNYLDKMVVHVRDVRSSTLEMAHHLLTIREQSLESLSTIDKRYWPDGFFDMSFTEQLDVQVQNYLPDAIKWIEGWLDASEDPSFRTAILFVQYEKFVADEKTYFDTILAFYLSGASHGGIEKSRFDFQPFTPRKADNPLHEGEFHFRNARVDEWRDVFTPAQLENAAAMMPDRLLDRFAWPPR